ncbi:hypothetical protein [Flavobacterium sp. HTF]|uniref:hypothetical protein n=1 Tax=Flavobacterium sp. HTF TaxID=2170732 RepID=UPI000D5D39F6|nr:hypothetical protein [Flavobacterium sp. HTF]PWB24670.1 hypothetical protein DCO46_11175 [Flavobacterium sp. HTF]
MDILIYTVIAFACGLVPTLLTLWLNERVKGSVKNTFDKQLEVLKKEHSKEIFQFQSEINHLKSNDSFKFTKLNEIRLKVLAKTHQLLNENLSLLKEYTSPVKIVPNGKTFEESEREFSLKYREAHNKFLKYFNHNSIYLSEEMENLILDYVAKCASIFDTYDAKVQYPKSENIILRDAYTVYKKIPAEIHPLKKGIEVEFRKLLGE